MFDIHDIRFMAKNTATHQTDTNSNRSLLTRFAARFIEHTLANPVPKRDTLQFVLDITLGFGDLIRQPQRFFHMLRSGVGIVASVVQPVELLDQVTVFVRDPHPIGTTILSHMATLAFLQPKHADTIDNRGVAR